LKQGKLYELVATDFIERHLRAQQTDNYGFGGMIRERDVADFLVAEGVKITEGNLGLRFKPDNPFPNSYKLSPCPVTTSAMLVAPAAMTRQQIESTGRDGPRGTRGILKKLGLSQNGTAQQLKDRMHKHYKTSIVKKDHK
jgi:hypothetical protein